MIRAPHHTPRMVGVDFLKFVGYVNVTNEVFLNEENGTISFDHSKVADLQGYVFAFHDDIARF